MARDLHKTHAELLYGPVPLSGAEFAAWVSFYQREQKREQEAAERAKRRR